MFSKLRHRSFVLILLATIAGLSIIPFITAQDSAGTCPLGQRYWKIHTDDNDWPVTSLTLGGEEYTQAELLALLNMPVQGDASLILAYQLIAAQLNVANGADSAVIADMLANADAWLAEFEGKLPYGVEPASDIGQEMVIAGSTFDAFNQGFLVVDCVEAPETTPEPVVTPEVTVEPPTMGDINITIVVEGPVENINVNIITIYGIEIEVDPAEPILTVIQIGDWIRVEGDVADNTGGTIIIVAVNIIIINVEVYVVDGQVWRDPGNCFNAPPPWAMAHGWHARCDPRDGGGGSKKSNKPKSKKASKRS